jgi:hypothetical protein
MPLALVFKAVTTENISREAKSSLLRTTALYICGKEWKAMFLKRHI